MYWDDLLKPKRLDQYLSEWYEHMFCCRSCIKSWRVNVYLSAVKCASNSRTLATLGWSAPLETSPSRWRMYAVCMSRCLPQVNWRKGVWQFSTLHFRCWLVCFDVYLVQIPLLILETCWQWHTCPIAPTSASD